MKSPADVRRILDALETQHPDADTELHHSNAFELLVATILSAQSTDERVNLVTPALFKRYPTAQALSKATPAQLERMIHSTGFFRAKSRALIGMGQALVAHHGGSVPADMEALTALPGVGRKTANVVLGHALGVPGLPVDRHVLRVSNRIGIAESDDPAVVEHQLCGALPPDRWTRTSDTLILHGRRICRPKPLCPQCVVQADCVYFQSGAAMSERSGAGRGGPATGASRAGRGAPASNDDHRADRKTGARKAVRGARAVEGLPRRSAAKAGRSRKSTLRRRQR